MKRINKIIALLLVSCMTFISMCSTVLADSKDTLWNGDDISYNVTAGKDGYTFMSVYPNRAYEMSNHMVTSNDGAFNSIPQSLVMIEAKEDYVWKPDGKYLFGSSNYEVLYCVDKAIGYEDGIYYKRINLEDSNYYDKDAATHIRSIITNSYPYITLEQMKSNLASQGFPYAQDLTRADVISAVQSAIWYYSNSDDKLEYSHTFHIPTNTQWGSVFHDYTNEMDVWWQTGKRKVTVDKEVGTRINALITHLTKQDIMYPKKEQIVISNINISDVIPVQEKTDTYKMAVQVKLNNSGSNEKDQIHLTLRLDEKEIKTTDIELGKETYDFVIEARMDQNITVECDGTQVLPLGVYLYEPEGGRDISQYLVGASFGETDVYDIALCDIDNEIKVPTITKDLVFIKTNEDGQILTNSTFDLYVQSKESKIFIDSYQTDKNGQFIIDKLLPGTYEIIEKEAPVGYQLDKEPIIVHIDENGNLTINEKENVILDDHGMINITNKPISPVDPTDPQNIDPENKDPLGPLNLEPEDKNPIKPEKVVPPHTGDSSPIMLLIVISFLSLGCVSIIRKKVTHK